MGAKGYRVGTPLVLRWYWVRIMVALFGELAVHKTLQIGTCTHHTDAEHAKHDQKRHQGRPMAPKSSIVEPKSSLVDTMLSHFEGLNMYFIGKALTRSNLRIPYVKLSSAWKNKVQN